MTNHLPGHENVSQTKGRFDDEVFREATWEEAEELVAEKIAEHRSQERGGNTVALYGSGQLPVEGQYLENLFMKGVLGSNTIEANARMCMTSAVTGYFKSLGSDTPPTAYEDIELSGHGDALGPQPPRRAPHRLLAHRRPQIEERDPHPRRRPPSYGNGPGLRGDRRDENSYHFSTINGDISIHNALAHVMLDEVHEDAVRDGTSSRSTPPVGKTYIEGGQGALLARASGRDMTMIDPQVPAGSRAQWAEASIKGKKARQGRRALTFWGIGYNQHIHGQNNVVNLINLMALTGNIGRPRLRPLLNDRVSPTPWASA